MRQLTQKDIFDKNFSTKMRGFSPKEVDEFLDIIMHDYQSFEEEIEELQAVNNQLMARIDDLSQGGSSAAETLEEKVTPEPVENQASTVTNFDILKRISNLERAVFGSKLEESDSDNYEVSIDFADLED